MLKLTNQQGENIILTMCNLRHQFPKAGEAKKTAKRAVMATQKWSKIIKNKVHPRG